MINLKIAEKFNLEIILISLLPISLIIGNFALNLNVILIIIMFLVQNLNFSIFYKKYKYLVFLVSIFIILNSLFSSDYLNTLKGHAGILRYILFFFAVVFFFKKNKKNFTYFTRVLVLSILFVIFDSYIQFFFKQDIFGHVISTNHGSRLSGPFGDEYIVGAFLLKTIFFTRKDELFKNNLIWYIYLILAFSIIVLAYQRMPTILFAASLLIFVFFDNKINIKKSIIIVATISCALFFLFSKDSNLKKHYFDRTFEQIGIYKTTIEQTNVHKNFFDSQWGAHYLTAIEIFKDNKLLGSGIKTFRSVCDEKKYSKINSAEIAKRCSTHPHNIYLEILSESGFFGLIIFFILIIYFFQKSQLYQISEIKKKPEILVLFFIFLWPVQTTGSIFSTWNGFFYPLFFAYAFQFVKNKK